MKFEWDEEKARSNLTKHKIPFEAAEAVFDDPKSISEFDRVVDGEQRWRTIGRVGVATILFVAHPWLDDAGEIYVRIISALKADKREVRAYDESDERYFR